MSSRHLHIPVMSQNPIWPVGHLDAQSELFVHSGPLPTFAPEQATSDNASAATATDLSRARLATSGRRRSLPKEDVANGPERGEVKCPLRRSSNASGTSASTQAVRPPPSPPTVQPQPSVFGCWLWN